MNTATLTVQHLLMLDDFPVHEVVGGATAVQSKVSSVVVGTSARNVAHHSAGSLVVFGRGSLALEDPLADLAIRLGRSSLVAGIVAERPAGQIPLATLKLADKFNVPLIVMDKVDPEALVAKLDLIVRTPEIVSARAVERLVQRLQASVSSSEALLGALGDAVDTPVALINAEGKVLDGNSATLAGAPLEDLASVCVRTRPVAGSLRCADGEDIFLQPALLGWDGPAELWFAARVTPAAMTRRRMIEQSMVIAALAFSARFSRNALVTEKNYRERGLLLTEILDQATAPRRSTIERAAALGWRLSGWHMGVHISISKSQRDHAAVAVVPELEQLLRQHSINSSLFEKPDGWVFWVSKELEPQSNDTLGLTNTVRRILLEAQRNNPRLKFNAGIGRPYLGTAGIQRSLIEARQACMLAQTSESPTAVEHVDAMNVTRLMTGWYNSEPVRETARQLLAPLYDADPTGELVRTLRCYLDHESSATTTSIVLNVHRNTVMQRLAKIRTALPLDLDRPDERLAAHLATRGTEVEWDKSLENE
ncbi:PucR family transcriptional regulator [Arthrobacter bambusae]|uniref:PucR family transcriptional regulator n=1 Tax=Arthrobacter bambusae TaxID=1338426 RepID=UPI00277F8F16|nr:helix-turn-helix domain-containing protein [Arthrobacter bambusae]MDQ0212990.1 sugar diacid utilization regulator [Arthrobacter bambusae]MDQ0237296.1 sugar diacid utilization regulator [Arthrobacter bambusae]